MKGEEGRGLLTLTLLVRANTLRELDMMPSTILATERPMAHEV